MLLLVILVAGISSCWASEEGRRVNSAQHLESPYLVLVSVDGMRWDYPDLFGMASVQRIAARGLKSEALEPVFPTLTFPNHFSIATGLLPEHHGLVANKFPGDPGQGWYFYKDRNSVQDGRWYLADPIWVTAEKQGMLSAAYYFVGTEADIGGYRPTHWRNFDAEVSGEDRVQQVLDWLALPADTRPHLITLYFEDVDDGTHDYGVNSARGRAAIDQLDANLGQLLDGIALLPHGKNVYLVLVSDHGMAAYDASKPVFVLDQIVNMEGIRAVEGGPYVFLYLDPDADKDHALALRDTINKHWECGHALLPSDAPPAWGIGASPRWPDLIAIADPGCAVISTRSMQHKITAGDHGWAPEYPDMRGVFYAAGPRIPPGTRIGRVSAMDIYPLMMAILGLVPPHDVDGDPALLPSLLLPESDMR